MSLTTPKLVLVGGSNIAFGIDSTELERALGRPVVNLGISAAMGRELMLRQAEAAARPGDWIVLSPEYALWNIAYQPDESTLLNLMRVDARAARFIAVDEVPALLDHGLGYFAERIRDAARRVRGVADRDLGLYARASFDARGDVVSHRLLRSMNGGGQHAGMDVEAADIDVVLRRVNRFADRIRAAGAVPVLSLPPIPEDDTRHVAQVHRLPSLVTRLERELAMPLLEREVPAYPRSLFLDTAYHLTGEGTVRRTRELADSLTRALHP